MHLLVGELSFKSSSGVLELNNGVFVLTDTNHSVKPLSGTATNMYQDEIQIFNGFYGTQNGQDHLPGHEDVLWSSPHSSGLWTNHQIPRGVNTSGIGPQWGASQGVVLKNAVGICTAYQKHFLLARWIVSRWQHVEFDSPGLTRHESKLFNE